MMHTRNLCPREGIEDPAWVSAMALYLRTLASFAGRQRQTLVCKIEQGNVGQMPSLIHTRTIRREGALDVFVGGAGLVMLEGNLLV